MYIYTYIYMYVLVKYSIEAKNSIFLSNNSIHSCMITH